MDVTGPEHPVDYTTIASICMGIIVANFCMKSGKWYFKMMLKWDALMNGNVLAYGWMPWKIMETHHYIYKHLQENG